MKLPKDFYIGTSSSAWQIEGNGGKTESQKSWADLFYETNPDIWHNGIGPQRASDFYHFYKEDIQTMASFGMNVFRLTLQWARLMKDPFQGIVDLEAVSYYKRVMKAIHDNGMKVFVSLEHWDIPAVLFEKLDGWVSRETIDLYELYVEKALETFKEDVDQWFAFTEPNVPIDNGYMEAIWYPFEKNPKKAYQAHFHKILATSKAVRLAHSMQIQMGVMIHYTPVYARSDEKKDTQAAYYADLFYVRMYLDAYVKGTLPPEIFVELKKNDCLFEYKEEDLSIIYENTVDLLGLDYYFPIRVKGRETEYQGVFHPLQYYEPWIKPDREFNQDRGWEIYPEAIYDAGMRIKEEYGNVDWLISENGIGIENEGRYRNPKGYIDDDYRIDFIQRHLENTLRAKEAGCHVHGYLIWSFVDNVSALNAFKNRYGLLELDLNTYQRIPKKSLYWLSKQVKRP